jgi:thioesterase domain-containing protein
VLLKPGDGSPPLFFVHGMGGGVAELFHAARAMSHPGPVFGIRARGLRRRERTLLRVQSMAAAYLRELKSLPSGRPLHLCGYSFGGLVAFEMACRLRASGEDVGLVGLLDTQPCEGAAPCATAPAWTSLSFVARKARQAAELPAFLKDAPVRTWKVATGALIAAAQYRPGFYPGELTLFTPLGRDPALPDPLAVWGPHARAVSRVTLPGTHLTMLSRSHAGHAAASLSRQLALAGAACGRSSVG